MTTTRKQNPMPSNDPALPAIRLIGHRGAPTSHRENTIAAIEAAIAEGAGGVEIDVRLTADGVPALLHDATLERLWGDPRPIAEVNWAEVEQLGAGAEHIPSLASILERFGREQVMLVLDVGSTDHARGAATIVASSEAANVAWCGAPDAMVAVRDILPDASVWLAWETLELPVAADLERLQPDTLNVDVAFLTPDLVSRAHQLGLRVSCWTIDRPSLAVWAANTGVDLMITNDLVGVRGAIEGRGPSDASEITGEEIVARAHALALEITQEVIALTIDHPVTTITTKSDAADLVTDVDRLIEQHVRGRIRAAFPTHGFSGEEYGDSPGDEFRWYLDPVDGTTNLARGIRWTSMSLCLTQDGRPVLGVVADPWRGDVMVARRGHGAHRGAVRLSLPPHAALAGHIVGTELDGHRPWPGFSAFLDALADRLCTLRVMGTGTMTLAQVASGSSVGACVSGFDPIDHGAALLLVWEAGGVVFDDDGPLSAFPARGASILVAHPAVGDELFRLWRSARFSDG